MAYSTLPTQSAGGTASAAGWANIVKADLESMMHLVARKTADQSVTSSVTFVDCTTMVLPVLANEIWQVNFAVLYSGSTTGDIQFRFTHPAGGRIDVAATGFGATLATEYHQWCDTATPTAANSYGGSTASNHFFLPIEGIYTTAGTAGNVTLQFAQAVSDATATTVHANSTVWGMKLA